MASNAVAPATGQGDMAYGSLLGGGTYVCMYVVGAVLALKPTGTLDANVALVRDVASYLILLLLLLPVFVWGLTLGSVLLIMAFYVVLTGALRSRNSRGLFECSPDCSHTVRVPVVGHPEYVQPTLIVQRMLATHSGLLVAGVVLCSDLWHRRGRPPLRWPTLWRADDEFAPLLDEGSDSPRSCSASEDGGLQAFRGHDESGVAAFAAWCGPSFIVRCLSDSALNTEQLCRAAVPCMHAPLHHWLRLSMRRLVDALSRYMRELQPVIDAGHVHPKRSATRGQLQTWC